MSEESGGPIKTEDLLQSVAEDLGILKNSNEPKTAKSPKANVERSKNFDSRIDSIGQVYIAFAQKFIDSTKSDELKYYLGIIGESLFLRKIAKI